LNILGRFTARWLVGLLAVLTVLSHVSDAGRTARSGFDLGQAILSAVDPAQPVLASEAPQGEIRFGAGDKQPHVGGKPAGDAVLPAAPRDVGSERSSTSRSTAAKTPIRNAFFVPGQRAPPPPLQKT
jgi:hypothetical protein